MLIWQEWRALRGPNVWSAQPVIEARVSLADTDVNALQTVWTAIAGAVSHDEPPEELARDAVETVCAALIELQRAAGSPVSFAAWRPDADGWRIALAYEDEELIAACRTALDELLAAAAESYVLLVTQIVTRLQAIGEARLLGSTTRLMVAAARERGIPVRQLSDDSLVQLGHGFRQRRLSATVTTGTGELAEQISSDKWVTKQLLRQIGLPVPDGRVATSADDAWSAARELGGPVVVKPRNADFGQGVTLAVADCEAIATAFEHARTFRPEVLVERFHSGISHRLLVVGRRLVAAVRREPARVVGNGQHSIRELVDAANRDPRRGNSYEFPLFRLNLDDAECAELAQQGRTIDSIPARGETVYLRREPHTYYGGTNEDVTERVHPETVRMAIDAVLMVGLDVAGIDLVAGDISRPLRSQGGAFLEVNAEPAINLHRAPVCDRPRPVVEAILEELFPQGENGRIPLIGVVGAAQGVAVARLSAECWSTGRHSLGLITTRETLIDGCPMETRATSTGERLDAVWAHPRVGQAIVQTTLYDVLAEGMPWDRCRRLIVVELGSANGVEHASPQDLDRAWRTLMSTCSSRRRIILNVDDAVVAQRASAAGRSACLVSNDPQHPLLLRAQRRGQPLVTWRHGEARWRCGNHSGTLARLDDIPRGLNDYEQRRHYLLVQAARLRFPHDLIDAPGPRSPQTRAA